MNTHNNVLALLLLVLAMHADVASRDRSTHSRQQHQIGTVVRMRASSYGRDDGLNGTLTANCEIMDWHLFTAAHKTLPFGTRLRVRYPTKHTSVVVRINDRGPFVKGRDLDLSTAAAEALGMHDVGVANVEVEILYVPKKHDVDMHTCP
jgi:rare lipoprotein A